MNDHPLKFGDYTNPKTISDDVSDLDEEQMQRYRCLKVAMELFDALDYDQLISFADYIYDGSHA